eukprot:3055747-Amphidinium_carterae.1
MCEVGPSSTKAAVAAAEKKASLTTSEVVHHQHVMGEHHGKGKKSEMMDAFKIAKASFLENCSKITTDTSLEVTRDGNAICVLKRSNFKAHSDVVRKLCRRFEQFRASVMLANGTSHTYRSCCLPSCTKAGKAKPLEGTRPRNRQTLAPSEHTGSKSESEATGKPECHSQTAHPRLVGSSPSSFPKVGTLADYPF